MNTLNRRSYLVAIGAALAGCTSGTGTADTPKAPSSGTPTASPSPKPTAAPVPPDPPSADARLPLPMTPAQLREEARSGGPRKDGIPSIDDPSFVNPGDVDYLRDGDPVFGVARGGVAKAYPQKILVHHEIVNDELGELPVSVTYCPLTGTVQGFERGGTTFGVSGRLINNNLVMYDRATEAWWPQILATAIPGPWNEDPPIRSLREFRLVWTTWRRWRTNHPGTRILSLDTGSSRNYGADPYGTYNPRRGYYADDTLLIPALNEDDRFERKRVVMGARTAKGAVAFSKDAIRSERVMEGRIGADPVLAVYDRRYDTAYVYRNPSGLDFTVDDGSVRAPDDDLLDPDRLPLTRIHTFDAMWFAWAGYYPETAVYA